MLSIVAPVYNEQKGIPIFYKTLVSVLKTTDVDWEVIFINDGSTDGSLDVLRGLHQSDRRIKVIDLSRNFGHQNALTAGIDFASGSAIVLIDVDMEDNPQAIVEFLAKWRQGYQVVYAVRGRRQVSLWKRWLFNFFHQLNVRITDSPMDTAGTFCLMDRQVADQFKKFSERDRYIPGLRAWVGFKQIGIKCDRGRRYDGHSRVGMLRLVQLAMDSIFSFSTLPLKMSIFFGCFFALMSFCSIIVIISLKLFTKLAIPGWSSILSAVMLVGGVQLICLGFQGEYLLRVFNEVKNRPHYIVREVLGFHKE